MSSDVTPSSFYRLSETLSSYRAQIDRALFAQLQQRKNSPFFAPLLKVLTGGKRLRPILLLLAFESVGGQGCDPLPAAVAIELAHLESLIHDDVIDGDVTRRGSPAFHASYGYEMALLSADYILSFILSITARYSDPRVAEALATATACMCEGELVELNAFAANQVMQPETYLEIITKKTSVLFEAAAQIGAVIGGGTHVDVESLSTYARALGIAYQIRDDLVDGIHNGSHSSVLDLTDARCSQDEYLRELAANYTHDARSQLHPLRPSEAKYCLEQLAIAVDSKMLFRI